jgi:hypothetical protein
MTLHWYRGDTVRGSTAALRWLVVACGVPASLLAYGCGEAKRDAGEQRGTFSVELLRARFPTKQAIAHDSALEIEVRNAGTHTIPNVAVTVDSFSYTSAYPQLAANLRPVWIVNRGPGSIASPPPEGESVNAAGGAETAFVNTWALGALRAGASKTFVWKVTPVKAGTHTLHFQVAAGLDGKAVARLASDFHAATGTGAKAGARLPVGQFTVHVAALPRLTHVNPETGAIAGGPSPTPAGPLPAAP